MGGGVTAAVVAAVVAVTSACVPAAVVPRRVRCARHAWSLCTIFANTMLFCILCNLADAYSWQYDYASYTAAAAEVA